MPREAELRVKTERFFGYVVWGLSVMQTSIPLQNFDIRLTSEKKIS